MYSFQCIFEFRVLFFIYPNYSHNFYMDKHLISEYDDYETHPDFYEEDDIDWEYLQSSSPYAYQLYQLKLCLPSLLSSFYPLLIKTLVLCSIQRILITFSKIFTFSIKLLGHTLGSQLTNILISLCGIYLLLSNVSQLYFVYLILIYCLISTIIFHATINSHTGYVCALTSFTFIVIW